MIEKDNVPRIPWLALLLSLLSAGVGHVYCGRLVKGLAIFSAWALVSVLFVTTALLPTSNTALVGLIAIPLAGLFLLYFYAAGDAWRLARRASDSYALKDYNRPVVYVLLIVILPIQSIGILTALREFTFEAYYIPTRSMSPSVMAGDRILVNKLTRRHGFPRRGDLIAFRNHGPGAEVFIKRVIAIAGDAVEMRDNEVWINGEPLRRDPVPLDQLGKIQWRITGKVYHEENAGRRYQIMLDDPPNAPDKLKNLAATEVPQRSMFVLGDNRDNSRDSRHFGCIHAGDIVGYPQYRYFPAVSWSRFGAFQD